MERDPNVVPVQSSFGRRREPPILIGAIVVFLVVAIVKPWTFGAPTGSAMGTPIPFVPSTSSGDLTTPPPSPATAPDPNAMGCLGGDTEQLVLLERWPGSEIRSWIVASDVVASGPLDPRITRIVVFSKHLVGLGICAPRWIGGVVAVGATIVDIQAVIEDGQGSTVVKAVELGAPGPITLPSTSADAAILYGPPAAPVEPATRSPVIPTSPLPGPRIWPAGSYALAFTFPADPSSQVRWLRIEIRVPAGPG